MILRETSEFPSTLVQLDLVFVDLCITRLVPNIVERYKTLVPNFILLSKIVFVFKCVSSQTGLGRQV